MIGYTTIGVSDMDKACTFYSALLAELGATQLFGMDRIKSVSYTHLRAHET